MIGLKNRFRRLIFDRQNLKSYAAILMFKLINELGDEF